MYSYAVFNHSIIYLLLCIYYSNITYKIHIQVVIELIHNNYQALFDLIIAILCSDRYLLLLVPLLFNQHGSVSGSFSVAVKVSFKNLTVQLLMP